MDKSCISKVLFLSTNLPNCSFKWVCKETNRAPHVLATWSLKQRFWGSFNVDSGPQALLDVISEYSSESSFLELP